MPILCVNLCSLMCPRWLVKGFDDLGGTDGFPTEMLEWRLGCAGVINYSGNLLDPPTAGGDKTHTSLLANKIVQRTVLNDDSDNDD